MNTAALSTLESASPAVAEAEEKDVAEAEEKEGRAFYVVTTLAVGLMALLAATSLTLVIYAHLLMAGNVQ